MATNTKVIKETIKKEEETWKPQSNESLQVNILLKNIKHNQYQNGLKNLMDHSMHILLKRLSINF